MTFQQHLEKIGACEAAREWAKDKTSTEAWNQCDRVDWLLWWARRDGTPKVIFVKVACEIARSVVHLTDVPQALAAIEAAERWLQDPSEENRVACRDAADAVVASYAAADAAYAADAAARAAAAYHATVYAECAVDAAVYAAYAVATDAYAAYVVKQSSLEIIRTLIPQPWKE